MQYVRGRKTGGTYVPIRIVNLNPIAAPLRSEVTAKARKVYHLSSNSLFAVYLSNSLIARPRQKHPSASTQDSLFGCRNETYSHTRDQPHRMKIRKHTKMIVVHAIVVSFVFVFVHWPLQPDKASASSIRLGEHRIKF